MASEAVEKSVRRMPARLLVLAGWILAIDAVAHFFAIAATGLNSEAARLAVAGGLFALMAWGHFHALRWLAYPAFLLSIGSAVVAYGLVGNTGLPLWWLQTIIAVDVLAALTLFILVWRRA